MRFLRHGQSINPMLWEGREVFSFPSQAHRLDELHRVIPWQVARQQSLPPLRPAVSA